MFAETAIMQRGSLPRGITHLDKQKYSLMHECRVNDGAIYTVTVKLLAFVTFQRLCCRSDRRIT